MKKIMIGIILLMFCLKPFLTFSQNEWAPVGAKWTYNSNGHPFYIYSEKDTILDGIECRKLSYFNTPLYTYIDAQERVYFKFINDTQFSLLYDFSKTQGESWDVYDFSVIVDSVKDMIVGIDTFKIQYITNTGLAFSLGPYIIKGIGSYWFLLPTNMAADPPVALGLRCYSDSLLSYYSQGFNSTTCDSIIISVEENEDSKKILIYPNPVNKVLYIDNKSNEEFNIEVINIYGERILYYSKIDIGKTTLNIAGLARGIYVITLINDFKRFSKIFIKQ